MPPPAASAAFGVVGGRVAGAGREVLARLGVGRLQGGLDDVGEPLLGVRRGEGVHLARDHRRGVGSKRTQPEPGKYSSGHACMSWALNS